MIRNSKLEIRNSLTKNRFFVKVFGCQYNEWDAARLNFALNNFGLTEAKEAEADAILILMCSVRQTAVDRVYSELHNYPDKKIVICGCILETDRKKFEKRGALIWDGEDFDKLAELLHFKFLIPPTTNHQPLTNFIPIMKGCNNFCSYCAVPYTRGREVSRPMEEILIDIKKLVESGVKEITLLGQNVNSYKSNNELGIKNQGKRAFTILVEKINAIPGDFQVTFTSNHPKDMSDDIIDAIATLPKVVKSVHLPLQSGSNKILKVMNRPYTAEEYLRLVESLKSKVPKVVITTDVIVGFPGETEEDFEETVKLFRLINFHQAYINKYSPREGTKAYALGDPIPWEEKERRWRLLNEFNKK